MMKRSPSSRLNGKSSASGSSPMGSRKKGTQNQHHERVGLSRAIENCNPNSRTLALPRRVTTTTFSKPSPKKPLFPKGPLLKTQNPDKTAGGGGENPDKGSRIHRRIASFHDAIIARNGDDGVGNSFRDDTRLSLQTPSRVFRTCSFREHPNPADSEIHHRDNNNTKKEGRVKHLVRAFEKLLSGKEENSDDHAAAGTADDQEPPKDKKGSGAGGAGKRIMKWAQNKFQGHSKGNRTTPIKELPSCQPNAASCSSPVNHFVTHRRTVSTSSAAYHFADYHYDESASQASLGSPLSFSSKRRMFSGKSSDFESQGTDEWRRQLKATAARPFNLRTEQRGAAKEEEFKKKIQEMNTEEDKLRIPVAQGLPWTTDEPQSLAKPPVKESTKPVDLKLYTDVRAVERAEFDHVIADKSRQIEEERMEQERLQKLAEEEETKRIRKYLIPRAQPMPFFDRPFVPKRSGKPPTIPQDPKFKNPNLNHKRARSMQSYSELYGSSK